MRKFSYILLFWMLLPANFPAVRAASVLNFPRLSYEAGIITGIAVVNPTSQQANVTLTAFAANGQTPPGKTATLAIPPNQQVSRLTSELFGRDLPADTVAWFQATSPVDGLTGFFLVLDGAGTKLDGADLPPAAGKILFNQIRIDSGYTTELNLINPGGSGATLQLQLVGAQTSDGSATTISKTLTLPSRGAARLDVQSFFETSRAAAGAYVAASSDAPIAGFELVKTPDGDLLGLNAKSASEQLTHLYFPQLAVLGGWRTEVGIENYGTTPAIVTLTAYRGDGRLFDTADLRNNPVTRSLEAGAALREDAATMFGFSGPASLDGWIKVESTASAINGYVTYGVNQLLAAVTSQAQGSTRALFSHIATTSGYFNGMALLNPTSLTANVRVVAMQPSGRVLGQFDTVLQPGQRISRLIHELIPQAAGQAGGILWVKSDQPIFLTELFGTSGTLANVPPQPAPDSYQPDGGAAAAGIDPPLAVVQTGASQQFSVQGISTGVSWKINGVASGNSALGTISTGGLYRAPATLPSPQAMSVVAEGPAQAAGATVDVYRRITVTESLGSIQAVAYLSSLQKLYQAELTSVSTAKPVDPGSHQGIFDTHSTVFEVGSGGSSNVAAYTNEIVSKMISFTAANGREHLLLAGATTGRIIRLDPTTSESVDVFSGLTEPTAMVIDPVTGDLLVAEREAITSIPASMLNAGLGKAAWDSAVPQSTALPLADVEGIAVDACTGDVYLSVNSREGFATVGSLRVLQRSTRQVRTLLTDLRTPGQLLALYRNGVTCPQAFHLLLAERGANRVALFQPLNGSLIPWLSPSIATDLILIPEGSPLAGSEGVLVVESLGLFKTRIGFLRASGLYRRSPINPPLLNLARPVEVTVNPASATMVRGATRQFVAAVTGSANTGVTWSATGGQVTAAGVYTAPVLEGTYRVRATANADPSAFAEAVVRVVAVQVTLSPQATSLGPGSTLQFTALVSGSANTVVTWTTTGGLISDTGLYTAPAISNTYTVRATAQADPSAFAEATVVVTSVQVSIAPPEPSVAAGGTVQFEAAVTGTGNTAVTWETTGGSITETGLYTAPDKGGLYLVRVISAADNTKFAQTTVRVTSHIQVTISPASATIPTGSALQLSALVSGSNETGVIWTASGGSVTASGLYTAPQVAGDYKVRAAAEADPTRFAEATVKAVNVGISISPTSPTIGSAQTQQFTAIVTGIANTAVTWFASGGSINATGLYTAPPAAGSYVVRAISLADPSKVAEAVVRVLAVSVSVTPSTVTLRPGASQQFTATVTNANNSAVTWTTSGGGGGGSISSGGLYTAPRIPGTYFVRATSQADSTKFGQATVTVEDDIITVNPRSTSGIQ